MIVETIRYVDIKGGQVLWEEPMIFKNLFAVGDEVCEKGQWYLVQGVRMEGTTQVVVLVRASLVAGNCQALG